MSIRTGPGRPLVAMDVDDGGAIYIVTAFDPEAMKLPNPVSQ